jgi:hypothetical protein
MPCGLLPRKVVIKFMLKILTAKDIIPNTMSATKAEKIQV